MKSKNIVRFIIFCFVGGTSALVHVITFNLFFFIFRNFFHFNRILFGASLNYINATIAGTIISLIYNFTMNRNITFSAKKVSIKKQIPKYAIIYSISISTSFIVNILTLNLLGSETILNANIATVCGIMAGIPISFFGSLLWAFKKND